MEDSVFTKIIKGEIPCHKVYEDEFALAFMDIHPIQPGHVTVVTKQQVEHIEDLDETVATGFWRAVQVVTRKLRNTYPHKKKIGIQVEGLEVPHVHAKLFPFDAAVEYHAVPALSEPDHAALAALAELISSKE